MRASIGGTAPALRGGASIIVVIGALSFTGCGKSEQPDPETGQSWNEQGTTTGGEAESQQTAMSGNCPMHVQGTSVEAENIEGGAALVFITTGDTDALRERVRNMAATHESSAMRTESQRMGTSTSASDTKLSGGMQDTTAGAKDVEDMATAPGAEAAAGTATSPDVDTRVEDIPGGARLIIVATNAADVEAVRATTEQQAQQLTAGECPMTTHSHSMSGTVAPASGTPPALPGGASPHSTQPSGSMQ
jgi:hypothetical protein